MKAMKVVRIQGGLGNQLFGLAFARSVALIGGGPVGLDLTSYGADAYGRRFLLAEFADDLGLFQQVERPWLGSRPRRLLGRLAPTPAYVSEGEAPTSADALAAMISRGSYFDGYWQNQAYIHDFAGFRAAVAGLIRSKSSRQEVCDVVIHYRTYKEERRPTARLVPASAYFRDALARIAEGGHDASSAVLISDDLSLARERLGDIGATMRTVAAATAWDDLSLMLEARALILTNSSFSWWGGACAETATVFYPRAQGFTHYATPARQFICL